MTKNFTIPNLVFYLFLNLVFVTIYRVVENVDFTGAENFQPAYIHVPVGVENIQPLQYRNICCIINLVS